MTDSALLRMARIVAELARVTYDWKDARCVIAEQLVRDLEAAPQPEPARRTITREEFNAAKTGLFAELVDDARTWAAATDKERMMCHNMATHCAYAWRLTVEDA